MPKIKVSPKERHLLRTYGITQKQYNTLLKKQKNSCGVCLRDQSNFTKALCVDHDHRTKEVRGLLCTFCNRYVIGKHRDPLLFSVAARYLTNHTGLFVPEKKKKKRKKKV